MFVKAVQSRSGSVTLTLVEADTSMARPGTGNGRAAGAPGAEGRARSGRNPQPWQADRGPAGRSVMTGEVAVIAGTPYDSGLGADLLRAQGVVATPYPMAGSPDEQDSLQDRAPEALAATFHGLLDELRQQQVELAMLFCSSLSSVVNHDDTVLPVVSPLTIYREILPQLRSSLVLAGNAHALLGVERTTRLISPGHRMLGVSDPMLVRGIENGDPAAAFAASQLQSTLRRAEQLGLEAVILACTHFATIGPAIASCCDLPVIDVGSRFIELTVSAARNRPGAEPSGSV
jgi:glutamate racemase